MIHSSRTVKVKKQDLIEKIKSNKEKHIEDYKKAVIAYKKEALKQLKSLSEAVEKGELNAKLDLTTPVNNEKKYDKQIEGFEWEVRDEVELTIEEFNEYVQDESSFARHALISNSMYLSH